MKVPSDTLRVLVDTPDVRVAEFSLSPGEAGDSHYHSAVKEYCYCMEGSLAINLQSGPRQNLAPGEKLEIQAGVPHQVVNTGAATCRYLVIQGVGAFDYVHCALADHCD